VNNHNKIKLITTQVGAASPGESLSPLQKTVPLQPQRCSVQVDGVPIQSKDKRSFEALSAVVYRPENICTLISIIDRLRAKTVHSVLDDDLATMKTYLLNAALKQGMVENTVVTALADGALNCWSVISSLCLIANSSSAF